VMAPSERAKRCIIAAEVGSAAAHTQLGQWHRQGVEGLEQDDVKAAACFRKASDLGLRSAQYYLAWCYYNGQGVEQSYALATEWGRKAADQGDAESQFLVGTMYALGQVVKKDLPLGKLYLELGAAQGCEDAIALLKDLRKCVGCGKLDVHHMICSRCHNRRYCGAGCQLRHWNSPTDPHRLHCVKRRESAGLGGFFLDATTNNDESAMKQMLEVGQVTAAAAAVKMNAAMAAVLAARAAAKEALTEAETMVATAEAAGTVVKAARAAVSAAPATSKKEKKKKAKLVAKVKAAETAAQAAVEAEAAWDEAEVVAQAAMQAAT